MARSGKEEASEGGVRWPLVFAAPFAVGLVTGVWLVRDRENGVLPLVALSHQVSELDREVRSLEHLRDERRLEVEGLQSDRATIERHARESLGMARPDELVVRFD